MEHVAINSFVRRQTPESPYTHFEGLDEDLLDRTRKAINRGDWVPGYREGVICVSVDPDGFFTGIVKLQEGDKLVGEYKARRPGEAPRQSVQIQREDGGKVAAKQVQVICYSHATLAEDNDAETDADWEIVSINGYPTVEQYEVYNPQTGGISLQPAPIEPFTLMHNHFGSDGGTATKLSPEKFETMLRDSFAYWKDRGMLA